MAKAALERRGHTVSCDIIFLDMRVGQKVMITFELILIS